MYKKGWTYKVQYMTSFSDVMYIFTYIHSLYGHDQGYFYDPTRHQFLSQVKQCINQIATGWSFNLFVLLSPGSLQEVSVVILLVLNTEVQQTR